MTASFGLWEPEPEPEGPLFLMLVREEDADAEEHLLTLQTKRLNLSGELKSIFISACDWRVLVGNFLDAAGRRPLEELISPWCADEEAPISLLEAGEDHTSYLDRVVLPAGASAAPPFAGEQ